MDNLFYFFPRERGVLNLDVVCVGTVVRGVRAEGTTFLSSKFIKEYGSPKSKLNILEVCTCLIEKGKFGPVVGWRATTAWALVTAIKTFTRDVLGKDLILVPEYIDGELFISTVRPEQPLIQPWV